MGTMPEENEESQIASKWHVGLLSGMSSSSEDNISNTASFGASVGYQPTQYLGGGFEAVTAKQDDANAFQRTTALIKATLHVGGDIPIINTAYVGGGIGPVFISNKVRWAGAPMLGFDVPLSSSSKDFMSIGLNAKYVFTTNNNEVPRELASALALKYWY